MQWVCGGVCRVTCCAALVCAKPSSCSSVPLPFSFVRSLVPMRWVGSLIRKVALFCIDSKLLFMRPNITHTHPVDYMRHATYRKPRTACCALSAACHLLQKCYIRKTDSIHHHHHHPEVVMYRSFGLNSNTFAVSKVTSRRWWCIESLFPYMLHATRSDYMVYATRCVISTCAAYYKLCSTTNSNANALNANYGTRC